MEDYLESVNGKNWRTKQRQILDSIMNYDKPKLEATADNVMSTKKLSLTVSKGL